MRENKNTAYKAPKDIIYQCSNGDVIRLQLEDGIAYAHYIYFDKPENNHTVQLSPLIYETLDEERKEKERYRKEQQRHRAALNVESDIVSYRQSLHTPTALDLIIHRNKLCRIARIVKTCTKAQQKRFYLNRILGYSLTEIGKAENCSKTRVKKSVDAVMKKLEQRK